MGKNKDLSSEQRAQIDALLQVGTRQKDIARIIGVTPQTISRELKRNSTKDGQYRWKVAQAKHYVRRSAAGRRKLIPERTIAFVKKLITERQWSAAQIAGWLGKRGIKISATTIYRLIASDPTGQLISHPH